MKKLIRSLLTIAFLIGLTLSLIIGLYRSRQAPSIAIPQTTLLDIQNQEIQLPKELNPPSILVFYLPQSPGSKQQLQILKEVQDKFGSSLEIYAIASGNIGPEELIKIKEKYQLNYSLLIDQKANLATELQIDTIPTIIIIDAQSNIAYQQTGIINLADIEHILQ